MRSRRQGVAALMVTTLVTAASLTACGGDEPEGSAGGEESGMDGMDGMEMSAMNDPDATPADEVDGEVTQGDFRVLDTAPPGSDGVTGRAWLAQTGDGTTVTIRLEGLEPGTEYVSHLHAEPCATENGGPHFAFDPDGEEVPPNEVHLGFTSGPDGTGEATVTNDRRVADQAPSVVVHPAEASDNRLACADFS